MLGDRSNDRDILGSVGRIQQSERTTRPASNTNDERGVER